MTSIYRTSSPPPPEPKEKIKMKLFFQKLFMKDWFQKITGLISVGAIITGIPLIGVVTLLICNSASYPCNLKNSIIFGFMSVMIVSVVALAIMLLWTITGDLGKWISNRILNKFFKDHDELR